MDHTKSRIILNSTSQVDIIKDEVIDEIEDTVICVICSKGFANEIALRNHVRVEHIKEYISGDPATWKKHAEPKKESKLPPACVLVKTKEVSPEKPILKSLASHDISYIVLKSDDVTPAIPKRKKKEQKEKKNKQIYDIEGPFECFQPSTLVEGATCHQIFLSCCEYSVHYRDEHRKRRKGLRCQVCEKPLALKGSDPQMPYTCEVCGDGFETSEALSEHTASDHTKQKPYECQFCEKRFSQLGGALKHVRMHTGDRPYACTYCPKAFTQKAGLDQHIRTHTKDRPYTCVVCMKTFVQSVHLKFHMRTHTNVAPFQCGFCDRRFKQSGHLNSHLKLHNPANISEDKRSKYTELISLITEELEVDSEADELEDPEQGTSETEFPMVENGDNVEVVVTTEENCNFGRGVVYIGDENLYPVQELEVKSTKVIVCEVCGKQFKTNATLIHHQRVHTGERPYPCTQCDKRFRDANRLRIHLRTHTGERPYRCAYCGKRFSQRPALIRHHRVHTGDKPYECKYCWKSFTQTNSLQGHIRAVHLKLPPNKKKTPPEAVHKD